TDIVPAVGVPLRAILNPNLADNGGPTLTHALVSGSPAIDAVPASADCGGTDQRGESRRQDGNGDGVPGCDIGAYEFGGVPPGDVGVPGPRPSKAMPWIPLLLLED
nr:choice-of-anchor Q domain-containing protein [Gammaproteobacteria bacterium]